MLPLIDLGGVWHLTYFFGLAFIVITAFAFSINTKLSWSVHLLWLWFILRCLFILEYPRPHFGAFTPYFQSTCAQAMIEAMLIPWFVLKFSDLVEKAIPYLATFSSICVWFNWPGLMHAPSFNMALAACCLPFVENDYLKLAIVLTALTHHGSTALIILGVMCIAGIARGVFGKRILLLFLPAAIGSAFYFQRQPAFNSGERLERWADFMSFWVANWKQMVFGIGPGSFVWYSVMTHKNQTGYFLQLHNDYLEIAWALGLIGVLLSLWVIGDAMRRAWKLPFKYFAGLCGALAFMLTYEPLEYFPSALLIAFYFSNAFSVEDINV